MNFGILHSKKIRVWMVLKKLSIHILPTCVSSLKIYSELKLVLMLIESIQKQRNISKSKKGTNLFVV